MKRLTLVIKHKRQDAVRLLLDNGADVNANGINEWMQKKQERSAAEFGSQTATMGLSDRLRLSACCWSEAPIPQLQIASVKPL